MLELESTLGTRLPVASSCVESCSMISLGARESLHEISVFITLASDRKRDELTVRTMDSPKDVLCLRACQRKPP